MRDNFTYSDSVTLKFNFEFLSFFPSFFFILDFFSFADFDSSVRDIFLHDNAPFFNFGGAFLRSDFLSVKLKGNIASLLQV